MIDLTAIDQDTIVARGQYATVRGAHEDEKKRLSILCGQFTSISSQVLRHMQPDSDAVPDMDAVRALVADGRELLGKISDCVNEIEGLAMQRAALKQAAWGAKK
jgi:hypothetical protein